LTQVVKISQVCQYFGPAVAIGDRRSAANARSGSPWGARARRVVGWPSWPSRAPRGPACPQLVRPLPVPPPLRPLASLEQDEVAPPPRTSRLRAPLRGRRVATHLRRAVPPLVCPEGLPSRGSWRTARRFRRRAWSAR